MYEVTIKKTFSAAHALITIGGQCEELHGHNFVVEISVSARELSAEGILIDFRIVKRYADEILKELDHVNLNETEHFRDRNPSSELIAKLIFDTLSVRLECEPVKVSRVTVWESENARVCYDGDPR